MDAGNASMYVIGPILSRISNGPQVSCSQFWATTQFQRTLLDLNFKNTMLPQFEFSMCLSLINITLLHVLSNLHIFPNIDHFLLHFS
jgi:hypothetical protein